MPDSESINCLVAGQLKYTDQFVLQLRKPVYACLSDILSDAKLHCEESHEHVSEVFEAMLTEVSQWNASVIQEEVARVLATCSFIMGLLKGIFVSNVMILTQIQVAKVQRPVKVQVPKADVFVHHVISACAAEMCDYESPDKLMKRAYKKECLSMIDACIRDSIAHFLPFQEIVENYINDVFNENDAVAEEPPEEPVDGDSDPEAPEARDDPEAPEEEYDEVADEGEDEENVPTDDDPEPEPEQEPEQEPEPPVGKVSLATAKDGCSARKIVSISKNKMSRTDYEADPASGYSFFDDLDGNAEHEDYVD